MSLQQFRKDNQTLGPVADTTVEPDQGEGFSRIRCPQCDWQPSADSLWCCQSEGTPEPAFEACGTIWNTFATRGRCPGCSHQWLWTTCLSCQQPSLHESWYEVGAT